MSLTDSTAEEWPRIQKRYSKLSDGELLGLLEDREQLTDVARELLAAEIKARRLTPDSGPEEETDEQQRFVCIAQSTDLSNTLFLKSALESLGIDARIEGQGEQTLAWFMEHAQDGLGLFVRIKDVDAAMEMLRHPYGEEEQEQ